MSHPLPVPALIRTRPPALVPAADGPALTDTDLRLAAVDGHLAHCDAFIESLTVCVLEVLAGVRDLDQLARWVSDEVYQNLARRVVLSARARQARDQRVIRPTFSIGRIITSEPAPGIVESVVVVHGRARTRAVAVRLESLETRWRASAITVL